MMMTHNATMNPTVPIKNTEAETGWKPTAYMKFVEAPELMMLDDRLGRKLQQLWIHSDGRDEWRDVPFAAKS